MDAVQALNVKRLYESNRRRSENVQKLMQEEAKKHALVVEKHENKMRTWRETLAHTSAEVQALRSKFQDLTGKLLPPLEAGTSSDGDAAPPRSLSGSTNGHANGAMLSPTIAAGAAQDAAQHGSGSAPADVAQMRSSGSLDMQDVLADYTMDLSKPEVAAAAELAENNTDAMEPPPIPATPEVHATAALHSPYAAGEHTTSPLKATADTGAPPHAAAGGEGGSDEELPEAEPADWPAPRLPPGFGGPAKVFPAPPPAAPYIGRDRHMSDSDQDSMDMHADPEDPYHTSPVAAGFVPRSVMLKQEHPRNDLRQMLEERRKERQHIEGNNLPEELGSGWHSSTPAPGSGIGISELDSSAADQEQQTPVSVQGSNGRPMSPASAPAPNLRSPQRVLDSERRAGTVGRPMFGQPYSAGAVGAARRQSGRTWAGGDYNPASQAQNGRMAGSGAADLDQDRQAANGQAPPGFVQAPSTSAGSEEGFGSGPADDAAGKHHTPEPSTTGGSRAEAAGSANGWGAYPGIAGRTGRGSAAAGPVGAPSADRDLAAPARVGNRRLVQLEASHAAQRARPDDLDSFHDEFPGLTLGGQAAAPSSGFAAAASANAVANARLHAHVDQEEEEFPGLNLGVVRRQEWSQDEGSKDAEFPSLGGAAPAARPAGVWGSASAARLLQQDAGKAMALLPASGQKLWPGLGQAAAPTPTSRPGVEKWEVEYELRVRSDLTPDIERRRQMLSKTDFEYYEEIRRRRVNVVDGLELHRNVLSLPEQEQLIECITGWVHDGREGRLRGRTFSAPRKWSPGKGRMTIQFGCCYNYAVDREGRKPGIIPEEVVEELPPVLVALCKRLVRWGVLPKALEPDSAIINVYEPGDCIPPHIDHHDFVRPFCTLSLLSQQSIMFGQRLVPLAPGQFGGSDFYVPLPTGSCLVLKGNGADVAMHCVPPVSERRMSITLRKMGPAHSDLVKQFLERQRARKNGW